MQSLHMSDENQELVKDVLRELNGVDLDLDMGYDHWHSSMEPDIEGASPLGGGGGGVVVVEAPVSLGK